MRKPIANARRLRASATDAERVLWRHLRMRQLDGHRFRRQHPIGDYIADFACLEPRLVVELDGGQHLERAAQDQRRTEYLNSCGFRVLRFWNNQVLGETAAVLQAILVELSVRHESE